MGVRRALHCKPEQKHPQPFLLYSRGEHCSPALAEPTTPKNPPPHPHRTPRPHRTPATPKIHPRTAGGPAMQAPTSERFSPGAKTPSLFPYSIVGASIARPPPPCAAARPLGWSRAPPLQCTARECVKFLSPFRNSIVGAGLGSARVCRTLALAFRPAPTPNTPALAAPATPQYTPAPLAGLPCRPLQAKGKPRAKTPQLFPII